RAAGRPEIGSTPAERGGRRSRDPARRPARPGSPLPRLAGEGLLMRFTKLVVQSFQALQSAEVELGPGLNVLYGPNDLGKSTLATAIRAALLVQPNSSEAGTYAPWHADATPRVSLTFVDDQGHFWKIEKAFGSGATNAAELQHSKDGRAFTLDCKGRQVEEKIRDLLGWGIPPPGGKGGPRGLPTSFLSNVLLAAQTDVDAILGQSLDGDLDGSGKLRLTKALATLAQDPLFKKVLDAAQRECDLCFTATGKRKRGQGSRFTEAGNAVKKLQGELGELEKQLEESCGIEEKVNDLRERRDQAATQATEAGEALGAMRRRIEDTRKRREAQSRLQEAEGVLKEIDAHGERTRKLASEVEAFAAGVSIREIEVKEAASKIEAAERALRAAEEAHRLLTSEDGARQREVRRAQLAKAAAELRRS